MLPLIMPGPAQASIVSIGDYVGTLGPERDADAYKVLGVFAMLAVFFWFGVHSNGGRVARAIGSVSLISMLAGTGLQVWMRLADPVGQSEAFWGSLSLLFLVPGTMVLILTFGFAVATRLSESSDDT